MFMYKMYPTFLPFQEAPRQLIYRGGGIGVALTGFFRVIALIAKNMAFEVFVQSQKLSLIYKILPCSEIMNIQSIGKLSKFYLHWNSKCRENFKKNLNY